MHNYRDLKVWQRTMDFTIDLYRETSFLPADERFGLVSQVRRAASAIPMNIAEGAGNDSNKEFCHFLQIALRSSYETMTAIDIARGLEYWQDDKADSLLHEANEICAMIVGLMKSLGWKTPLHARDQSVD